jgi:YVTN family beta-propeller protein
MLMFSSFSLAVASWIAATAVSHAESSLPLQLRQDVAMTGGPTRFDYQSVDTQKGRLYIAHLGSDELVAFDMAARKVVGHVKALASVHGVIAVPAKHRLFATATGSKELVVIDDGTLAIVARVPAGEYPNGLTWAEKHDKVYVSNNRGLGLGVVDTRTSKGLPGIDIGGGAGNSQYDPVSDRVLVVSHAKPELVAIDPARDVVLDRYPLDGVAGCHGLLVIAASRRAYVACGGENPKLVAFDLAGNKQIRALPIAPHPDVLAFDPGLRRLYVASSTGRASAFEENVDGSIHKLGEGFVGPNAHTVSVDPRTHEVFFPIEDLRGRPVLRIMIPSGLPAGAAGRP